MPDRIRFRAWLLGLGPVVLVVGILVALYIGSGKKPAPRAGAAASEPAPNPPETSTVVPTQPVAVPAAPPPPASIPPIVAAAASSLILAGPPPEPIAELDAFMRPKGSEQWTNEEKLAFRDQAFKALDAKDRSLVQEIAVARRRGDSQAVQEKQATLDYLRARRAQLDLMRQRQQQREAQRDAVLDSGAASD
jgi:hypothetical protein